MTTLIYSPAITIVVATVGDGLVDISEDIIDGSLTLRENAPHNFRVKFNNTYRKYDGIFTPNDRVVIQMKRLRWLQVFAGYLDEVPFYSTYPRPVELTGQCGLKILKNWPWDSHTTKARDLLRAERDRSEQDGGVGQLAARVLSEVVGWPSEKIHIGRVPDQWFDKFEEVYASVSDDVLSARDVVGSNPVIAGRVVGSSPTIDPRDDATVNLTQDMQIVLRTIRTLESGGNYAAVNRGDGVGDIASGAYQFVTSTWNNYRGYPQAHMAPPSVQDAKAIEYVNYIINRFGNRLVNVPYGWYYPAVFRDPSLLDKVPAAGEGNRLTIRQYGEKWVSTYYSIYQADTGRVPPSAGSSTAPITVATSPTSPTPGSTPSTTPRNSSDAIYPIPAGVSGLEYAKAAWGGYQNGRIPNSALKYARGIGMGHPVAVDSMALLQAAGTQQGYDFRGGCYRSYEEQVRGKEQNPGIFATAGRSIHGWGLAFDFSILTSVSAKYSNLRRDQMYDTPEYQWLVANAWRWGWGHPTWAQRGGSIPEPWHWEFLAFENFRNSPEARPGTGFNPSEQGRNPFDGSSGAVMPNTESAQLYNTIAFWTFGEDEATRAESDTLSGIRAPMNDTPVLQTISDLLGVSNRNYCSAPNGDFIAWFPDYWGEYGTAGRMNIELIELRDFTVRWSDSNMITHQYVEGALTNSDNQSSFGPLPQGIRSALRANLTAGIATVEVPRLLSAIVNMGDTERFPWVSDPEALLNRFGARINRTFVGTISGSQQEFWYAVNLFQHAWASMFRASVPLTFMPELFPGMILSIPELKVQFYVSSVTHSWNFSNDQGFSTDAETIAPSATDGSGFFLFPKGGTQPQRSTGSRGLFRS